MRVLLVDDSRAMRSIVARILRKIGISDIDEAADGQEALDRVKAGPVPDLALVDWNMPVMNGLDFVISVRKESEFRSMTIMMVTTENEHGQIVRALAAGAHEYLIKPFDEEALIDKLAILGFVGNLDEASSEQVHS
ncbi:MAG: response regulator [Acidobacteriota bacterium]|nr:response regulator [Acidobacteriota bacterium]